MGLIQNKFIHHLSRVSIRRGSVSSPSFGGYETEEARLHLQPLKATAETPAEPGRVVSHEHLPAEPDHVEAEDLAAMGHGDAGDGDYGNHVPLTDDPCRRRHRRAAGDHLRREPVEGVRVGEVGGATLMGLRVAQLDPLRPVEHLLRNRGGAAGGADLSG